MSRTLATLTGNNRHGTYTVTLEEVAGTGDAGVTLDLQDGMRLRWDRLQARYGVALLGSELTLTVDDPDEVIDALLGGHFADTDYRWSVTGNDGLGGTLFWEGLPMPSDLDTTAAPLVHVTNPVTLSARCGIGKASDVPGDPTREATLAAVLGRLQRLRAGTVLMGTTITAPVASDALLTRLRFTDEIEDSAPGSYGTVEDQLLAIARTFGLMLYQPSRAVSGGPGWHALPRARIGQAQAVTRFINANTIDAQSLTAQAITAADWSASDRKRRVDQVGTVAFDSATGGNLVQDGEFRLREGGTPVYWTPNTGSGRPNDLPPGQTLTQSLLPIGRDFNVYVRATLEQAWLEYTLDIYDSPKGWIAPAELAIYIETSTGARYYFPNWTTTPSGAGLATGIQETNPGVDTYLATRTSLRGVQPEGRGYVEVQGGATQQDAGTPTNADVRSVRVELVDASGDVIEAYAVRVGDGQGERVEITPLPPLQVFSDGLWKNDPSWHSAITTLTYPALFEATAAERIAQQGRPLRAFFLTLDGLIGPQFRLTVPGRDTVPESPIATAAECIPVGLEIDFESGTTSGVWVEAVTDGGASTVLAKNESPA